MKLKLDKWLNEGEFSVEGDRIRISAPALSDFFNNPVPENGVLLEPQKNAPFFYTDVEGDFVIRVKVKPEFAAVYDAACIMVRQDDKLWFKACYEKTDFGTIAMVSVVTNGVSDDANGCNLGADSIWLQVARVGSTFAIHYSLDGVKFDMVRIFSLPMESTVKVGIEAQCPTGQGSTHEYSELSLEKRSLPNIRAGK